MASRVHHPEEVSNESLPNESSVCFLVLQAESLQPAIQRVKGIKTVGNVVDGAMPKQIMETIPRRTETTTLRWSLMIDFKHSQNCKGKKHN